MLDYGDLGIYKRNLCSTFPVSKYINQSALMKQLPRCVCNSTRCVAAAVHVATVRVATVRVAVSTIVRIVFVPCI